MSEQNSQERNFPASPKRKKEFRDRGETGKSREVLTAIMLFTSLMTLVIMGPWSSLRLQDLFRSSFAQLGHQSPGSMMLSAIQTAGAICLPLFVIMMAAAILAHVVQGGVVFSTKVIGPKLERINPLSRAKQMLFSGRSFLELGKAVLKVALIAVVTAWILKEEVPALSELTHGSPDQIPATFARLLLRVGGLGALALAPIAAVDFFYNRHDLEKRMKMTQREVKEENKEMEGDPLLRSRRRKRHRELSHNAILKAVPEADVLVTNPTHLAIALHYDRSSASSPKVTAKGKDLVALRMRSIARTHGVPIVENKPLARSMYRSVKVNHFIKPEMFKAVAEIYAFLFRRQKDTER